MTYTYNYHSTHAHTVIKYEKDHSLSLVCHREKKKKRVCPLSKHLAVSPLSSTGTPTAVLLHKKCSTVGRDALLQGKALNCLSEQQHHIVSTAGQGSREKVVWWRSDKTEALRTCQVHSNWFRCVIAQQGQSGHLDIRTRGIWRGETVHYCRIQVPAWLLFVKFSSFLFSWLTELHIMNSSRENEQAGHIRYHLFDL